MLLAASVHTASQYREQYFYTAYAAPPTERILTFNVYNFLLQTSALGSLVDDWSVTAKQLLLGFAKQIKLPDRYISPP